MESVGKRRKVLIVEDAFRLRTLLSTFLASMGCEYGVASSADVRVALRGEAFTALVLDLVSCEVSAEELLLDVLVLQRHLLGRIIAITEDVISPQTKDLIALHCLVPIPRSRLFERLWPSLQPLLNLPAAFRTGARIARLVFDSFHQPLPAGVRGSRQSGRNLVYQLDGVQIDLLIEPLRPSARVSLVGHVLDTSQPKRFYRNIPVVLSGLSGPLARTATNQHGEFTLEFAALEYASLRLQVKPNLWVFIPLGDLGWLTKPSSLTA